MHAKFVRVDWSGIAQAIGLSDQETRQLFSDGRLSGELLQRVVIRYFGLIPSRNCDVYDATFPATFEKLEIRLITKYGIKTAPSNQIGSSREFNKENYIKKLETLDYFLFVDLRVLDDNIPCYLIPSSQIRKFYYKGYLSKDGSSSSRKTIAKLLFESLNLFWDLGLGIKNNEQNKKSTYSVATNILYMYFSDGNSKVDFSKEKKIGNGFSAVFDYSKTGDLVGIEFFQASEIFGYEFLNSCELIDKLVQTPAEG